MIKFLLITFLNLIITTSFFSQQRGGTIKGFVIDNDLKHPLEGCVIKAFNMRDTTKPIGTQTNTKGEFELTKLFPGTYKIEAGIIGYSKVVLSNVKLIPPDMEIILDTFKLKSGSTSTEEIEVTAEKNELQLLPDKKVFNVGNNPLNEGGNAVDVLRKVPSVTVDQDGNVSLRGTGNIKIMIDGRPILQNANIVLQQIPANMVESIELVTNPGAKYEAEGEGGIINLVLKKGSAVGYNVLMNLGAGNNDKYNASINSNFKNKDYNLFGSYSFNLFNSKFGGTSFRQNTLTSNPAIIDQNSDMRMRMKNHMAKSGIDLFITPKNTLSLSGSYSNRNRTRNELSVDKYFDGNNILTDIYNTNNNNDSKEYGVDLSLNYFGTYKQKQTLSGEISYHYENEDESIFIQRQQFDSSYVPVNNTPELEINPKKEISHNITGQLDYTHPLTEKTKFEAGLKTTFRKFDNDYIYNIYDYTLNQYVLDSNLTNHYKNDENVFAAYGIFSSGIKDFNYQIGLRSEYAASKLDVINNSLSLKKNYLDFFPNINLSQKLSKSDELQASYVRRINRPRAEQRNPFRNYSDPLNIRAGNPDLKPEYIDSYQLAYLKYFQGFTINPSVYLKYTHGLISRFRTLIDSITTLTTFQNLSSSVSYGLELIATANVGKILNANASFNYFKTKINGDNVQADLTTEAESFNTKLNTNMKLWGGVDMQMSYSYMGKQNTALGFRYPMQSFDVGFKKDFFDNKLTVMFRASDIFNTMRFKMDINNTGFIQNFMRKMDSRIYFISLSYKIGTGERQMKRERKRDTEDKGPGDVDF